MRYQIIKCSELQLIFYAIPTPCFSLIAVERLISKESFSFSGLSLLQLHCAPQAHGFPSFHHENNYSVCVCFHIHHIHLIRAQNEKLV